MPPNTGTIPFPGSGRSYSFSQLEQLFVQAGGHPQDAPLMAGIALSESSGEPWRLNNNPGTGDLSGGLWQINYFGSNGPARTALWGPETNLYGDTPQQALANAKAAVYLLYSGNNGLSNWAGDDAYKTYQNAGGGQAGVAAVVAKYGGSPSFEIKSPGGFTGATGINTSGGVVGAVVGAGSAVGSAAGSVFSGIHSAGDFLRQLSNPNLWIRIAEIVGGVMLVGLGLYVTVKDMGMSGGKLPGPLGNFQDDAAAQVRQLEFENRQAAAEVRSQEIQVRSQVSESRAASVEPRAAAQSSEFENRQKIARERYLQQRAKTRQQRARAKQEEAGATAASRRAERAKSIQMEEIESLGIFR